MPRKKTTIKSKMKAKPKATKKAVKKKVAVKKKRKVKKVDYQHVKGMHDILPQDQTLWEKIRCEVKNLADYYNFQRIDTPVLESADLFERSIGQATDIVEKQMFFIKSSKNRVVLRPEGTAPIARAYVEHGLSHLPQPLKLYYLEAMFRHEQPQEGRFRQFYQAGYEIIGGENDAVFDAQVILTCYRLLEALKITNLNIQVNTIGCKSCRALYRRRLIDYYKNKDICSDCKRRLAINPLRVLDCKDERCEEIRKDAPTILDSLCSACNCHFKMVLEYLEELNLPYSLNNYLVRGLDYYNQTVFEIFAEGFDFALAGGGRYDYLIEMIGGKSTPAVGASLGLERLMLVMKKKEVKFPVKKKPKVFLVHIGNLAKKKSLVLIEELKKAGVKVEEALGKESLNAQLRQADKEKAAIALIFGQKEAFDEAIIIRDLATGAQETVPLTRFVREVKRKLK